MAEWKTLFDLDFTALGDQALSPDGNYTIGGYVFTKFNSANDATAMALTSGSGIVIIPVAATDYLPGSATLPGLNLNLLTAYPSFAMDTPLRVWVYFTSNLSADYDGAMLTINNGAFNLCYEHRLLYYAAAGGISHYDQGFLNNVSQGDISVTGYGTTNVLTLECPFGVESGKAISLAGTWAAGWPAVGNMLPVTGYTMLYRTSINIFSFGGLATNWQVVIGAFRAGSATALNVTFKNMKVEYKI